MSDQPIHDSPNQRAHLLSGLGGIWAVSWRAFVYFPLALVISLVSMSFVCTLVTLPILAAVYISAGFYTWALGLLLLWFLVLGLWQWPRLGRFLRRLRSGF
jgi:hypothetical protein